MNNDFDHIKKLFDEDGIKAPESLSEDRIFDMLPDLEEDTAEAVSSEAAVPDGKSFTKAEAKTTYKKRSRTLIRRAIALAACALIAITGVPRIFDAISSSDESDLISDELVTYDSYRDIEKLVKKLNTNDGFTVKNFDGGITYGTESEESALEDSSTMSVEDSDAISPAAGGDRTAVSNSSGDAGDHSSTYLQVEDVDEADIVKTDGKYIYYVNEKSEVVILEANAGKTKKIATIGYSGVENYINDIFLKGNILVTIGTVYDEEDEFTGHASATVYDITDRTDPELVNVFSQSGSISSSRMIGDYVYLVTTEHIYNNDRFIPKCTADGKYGDMPVADICGVPRPKSASYVILSAVDVTSGKTAKCKSKAVFGASENIYCNDHNLYVASTDWNWDGGSENTTRTRILKAGLDGLDIRFSNTATVRGYVNNQFSMNEKDGYFFIATTAQRGGMDVNNLFVLDGDLKEAGKVTGFARNESIKSVRFLGNKAYVITYEAIDPLFVIDVSDPVNPKIEGEVKIDGFSTLLVPAGENRLLGIGYATGDNGYGGEYSAGLKLALFDVSDPSAPEVISSKEFKDMDSPAQLTHLALTVNEKSGWYAIPYSIYTWGESQDSEVFEEDAAEDAEEDVIDTEEPSEPEEEAEIAIDDFDYESNCDAGVLVFSADGKIKVIDQHSLCHEYLHRCVYIGNYIYALDGEGNTYSFEMGH